MASEGPGTKTAPAPRKADGALSRAYEGPSESPRFLGGCTFIGQNNPKRQRRSGPIGAHRSWSWDVAYIWWCTGGRALAQLSVLHVRLSPFARRLILPAGAALDLSEPVAGASFLGSGVEENAAMRAARHGGQVQYLRQHGHTVLGGASTFIDQNNPKRQTADPDGVHRNWTYSGTLAQEGPSKHPRDRRASARGRCELVT